MYGLQVCSFFSIFDVRSKQHMLSFITVPEEESKRAYFDVSTQEFPVAPHPSIEIRLGDRVGTAIYEFPVNFEAQQVDPPPPPEN